MMKKEITEKLSEIEVYDLYSIKEFTAHELREILFTKDFNIFLKAIEVLLVQDMLPEPFTGFQRVVSAKTAKQRRLAAHEINCDDKLLAQHEAFRALAIRHYILLLPSIEYDQSCSLRLLMRLSRTE